MKKKFLAGLATGLLMVGMAGSGIAAPISYNEVYNPDILMAFGTTTAVQTWIFNITDNPGWSTGQTFNNGSITLTLEDDKGPGDGNETATFTFDGDNGFVPTNPDISSHPWQIGFTVDKSAFSDGLISATLTATDGDFYFRKAELNVTSDNGITPPPPAPGQVPEPATMLLFGTGLIGLAGLGRKKLSK